MEKLWRAAGGSMIDTNVNTILLSKPKPPQPFHLFSKPNPIICLPFNPSSSSSTAIVRCSSSATFDWNTRYHNGDSDWDTRPFIPVRAFFFSTSIDLKSLIDQNRTNYIPPSSRMTNYVVFKFGKLQPVPNGLGPTLSGSDCRYMVVFQYGFVVLFNVRDNEVDAYLKIAEKHASGLLPEMRKDGEIPFLL